MSLKKVLLTVTAIVAVLLIAIAVLVYLLVTPERIKGWAVPQLEEHLQREVSLGEVEIGLLSGITLNDLRIKDRDNQNDLFRIGKLVLSYQLLPLLSGTVVVDEVVLAGPEVRLVQFADGRMNIDDLVSGSDETAQETKVQAETGEHGQGIALLVRRVLLEQGRLTLVREKAENISLSEVRVLATDISLDKQFPIEMSLLFNGTEFMFDGDFEPVESKGHLNLQVARLDLDRFLGQEDTAESGGAVQPATGRAAAAIGPIAVPVTLKGTVIVDELLYQGFTVTDLRADYRLADNRFVLEPLTGRLADGLFRLQTDVDLGRKGFAYSGTFGLEGLDLRSLIPVVLPEAENSTHGIAQLQLKFAGSGTQPEQILNGLASQGTFELANGKLMGSPLLSQLAMFLGNPELKVLSFQSLSGSYELTQGVAQLKLLLDSSKTRIDTSGTVTVDGDLNLQLATRLAPELIRGANVDSLLGRALTEPDGWAVLPLKISGTYTDPRFSFSGAGLREKAKAKAKEKLQEELQEKIGDKLPASPLLDKPLQKLFGD